MRIGSHVPSADPLATRDRLGVDVVQVHVSSPRTWKGPKPRTDAAELARSGRLASIHAPYLCNPASADPLVRERSTVLLQQTIDVAADTGAGGVVVHAGQAGAHSKIAEGTQRWVELLEELLAQFRRESGKGVAYLADHAGVFDVDVLDGAVPQFVLGNTGKWLR